MARTDASATPDTGLLKLAFRKADVSRLSVVGTDLVLVMKDGSQHVLQDMGLQAMTRPDLRVQFADGTADVSDLLAQAGPISLAKVVAEVAVSSGDGDPLQKNKASAAEVSADALATSDATAAPPGAPALAMEAQARGLIERDYIELQEPEIEDLRPLARALNVMVVRVRAMLDKGDREVAEIREQLDHDPLTKAATRPAFVDGLLHSLEHDAYGAVLLVHINDIEGLNLRLGRRRTDDFIVALATILRTRLMLALGADGFVLARLNGADFGVLMPGLVPESAITQVRLIEEALQVLSEDGLTDMALPAALGAARYRLGESLSDVLARADSGLGIAMAGRHFEIVDATPDRTNSLGVGQWRSVIESALGAGRVSLNMLQVVDARGTALHQEAQPLLTALDGRLVTASQLLPAAIRCGRSIDIGVRAIELALVALADVDGPLAVGVAAQCLEHPVFLRRLQALLRLHPVVAPRLVLEVQMNDASSRSLRSMANFAKAVNNLGCSVALGELGTQIELLSILDHARLRHVRLAQQAVVGLARQSHRRVFVKLMCELGGREGFAVVGPEGIVAEDQAALFALGGAGVVTPMELAASA